LDSLGFCNSIQNKGASKTLTAIKKMLLDALASAALSAGLP
jgi:hypothetical protein